MEKLEKITLESPSTLIKPKERFNKNYFETLAWGQNQLVCGIDEVGRGCLAGPLVTAAVILPLGKTSPLLKDSKIMTPEERLKAFKWIEKNCFYEIGIVHSRIIDQHNIWHATLIAMKRALVNVLTRVPSVKTILIDAMPLKLFDTSYKDIPVYYFPFGERKSSSIAAASIVAKVKRDALMGRLDAIFPGYHLGQHKGYSTPLHKKCLRESKSKLIIHRENYLRTLHELGHLGDLEEQQSLLAVATQEEVITNVAPSSRLR